MSGVRDFSTYTNPRHTSRMTRACALLVLWAFTGCGAAGSGSPDTRVDIAVEGTRQGGALHLEVRAVGHAHPPGTSFERAADWTVRATSNGAALQRLVNGSSRVSRDAVGSPRDNRWNVEIRFQTAFALPSDVSESVVWITPPGDDEPRRFVIAGL